MSSYISCLGSHKLRVAAVASFPLFLVAAPARADHDFTIQGVFTCTEKGVTMPVDGAIVGIMRDKPWAADPIVTEVSTGSDGSFSAQVHAKDVDTYYAKLFLNDKQGVFLHDWWTRSVREYNSATRGKNETAAIDLGGTNVSRDGGRGTPECAIWEGGHRAWQEYVSTTGQRPLIGEHGNYQITMESTDSGIVWTSRDTTHWEVNYPTAEFSDDISAPANPQQLTYADLFQLYGTNVHEFGHALRHTADGSDNHFNWDATRFFYGHSHSLCDSSPTGVRDNAGYGFNEGWADYWQGTDSNSLQWCFDKGTKADNFDQEAAVANDLDGLQSALGTCAGIPGTTSDDELLHRRRSLMFLTLSDAGHEKIHSEQQFRSYFSQRFPGCPMPAIGAYSVKVPSSTVPVLASHPLAREYGPDLVAIQSKAATLPTAIDTAVVASQHVVPTLSKAEQVQIVTKPAFLRGQLAYAKLIPARLGTALAKPPTPAFLMTAAGEKQRAAQAASFDSSVRAVTLQVLTEERDALLATGRDLYAEDIALLNAEIADTKAGSDRASAVLLEPVLGNGGDTLTAVPR